MPITAPQSERLRLIARDIAGARGHPSPRVRAQAAAWTDDELVRARKAIDRVIADDDGFTAHGIIRCYHSGQGLHRAVMFLVRGQEMPLEQKV